jgi:hypothetical protein
VALTFYSLLDEKTHLHELFLAVADINAYVEGRGRMCSGWNNLNASSMALI